MKNKPCLLIALLCTSFTPFAQTQKIVADKIAAKIGDKIILASDIENAKNEYGNQGLPLPETGDCFFLNSELAQKELAIQGVKDSIIITDDEVDALIDNRIRILLSRYNLPPDFNVAETKRSLFPQVKEQRLAEAMQNKILEHISVTPAEVKAYFEHLPKDSMLLVPGSTEISRLIIHPKANKDIVEHITTQLLDWKLQAEQGKRKFDMLAKLYSMDASVGDNGGRYTLHRSDRQWDAAWFAAVWKLKDGQISPVIKSKFGYHIIQMVSRTGDDAIVRHILLIPQPGNDEITEAKLKLDSIRTQITSNKLSFGEAINLFADEMDRNDEDMPGSLDSLPAIASNTFTVGVTQAIENMQQGNISKPIAFKDERQRDAVCIIYVRKITKAHAAGLKDDYSVIAQLALQQKQKTTLQKWLDEHIATMPVSIDKAYADCDNAARWAKPGQEGN